MLLKALDQLERIERTIHLFDDRGTLQLAADLQQTITADIVIHTILVEYCNLRVISLSLCMKKLMDTMLP